MVRSQQTTAFIAGVILMGLGGLFLIAQLLGGSFWAYFWPYPIIAAGLTFLFAMVANGRGSGALAIPGSIITTIGVMLFIQNSFGWWESWSFAWTLIVVATGVGIYLMGIWNQAEKAKRTGLNVAGIGLLLLMLFGAFFGMGFSFLGFGFAARMMWPIILIGIGAFLVLRGVVVIGQRSPKSNDESSTPEAQPAKMSEEPTQSVPT
jgi:hypothetical protein